MGLEGGQLDGLRRRGVWCVWRRDVKCIVGPLSRSPLINSLTRSLLLLLSRVRHLPEWQNRPGPRKDRRLGVEGVQGGQGRLRGPPRGGDVSAATLRPSLRVAYIAASTRRGARRLGRPLSMPTFAAREVPPVVRGCVEAGGLGGRLGGSCAGDDGGRHGVWGVISWRQWAASSFQVRVYRRP